MSDKPSANSDAEIDNQAVVSRVKVGRKTVEHHRPTVEVEGQPLSEGFPVQKILIEVLSGEDKGFSATFEKPVVRIGADPLSDIVLADPTVSRMHAEIRRNKGGLELIDLDSTNGTFIDGMEIGNVEISPGTVFQVGRTKMRLSTRTEQVKIEVTDRTRYGNIIGQSAALREIFSILDRVAPSDLSVVIEGETGTGKELIAAAIHENSQRSSKPFVVFDCSAFTATLLESELFGHEKGAFSGASRRHMGVFERADGGTIFFDELGEMDIEFQAKFLRVLETGDVRRVGGESTFNVDVRVVAATNKDLESLVVDKEFREDLFYRLSKVRFNLPPLRERVEDIPLLAEHFLDEMSSDQAARPLLTDDAIRSLQQYEWPGNIRQLRNVVEKAVAMCREGAITADYLRSELGGGGRIQQSRSMFMPAMVTPADPVSSTTHPAAPNTTVLTALLETDEGKAIPFRDAKDALIADFEKTYLTRLLIRNENNISQAAREAEVDRRHLYRLLKKHDLMDS